MTSNRQHLHSLRARLRIVAGLVGAMWLTWATSLILPLTQFGIRPRALTGLPGIVLAPLLHSNLSHLTANTTALGVLAFALLTVYPERSVQVLAWLVVGSGLGTWIIGRPATLHIGASGVVFGLLTYLIVAGWLQRRLLPAVVALLVAITYGPTLWGVLPMTAGISWEAHLSGAATGILLARLHPPFCSARFTR